MLNSYSNALNGKRFVCLLLFCFLLFLFCFVFVFVFDFYRLVACAFLFFEVHDEQAWS